MVEGVKSTTFDRWLSKLRDRTAVARVLVRIDRLSMGNPGDVKPVGHGISELRIDYGPGYRIYYLREGERLILLLCGGDKTTQQADISQPTGSPRTGAQTKDAAHECEPRELHAVRRR